MRELLEKLKGRSLWRHALGVLAALAVSAAILALLVFYKHIRLDALVSEWGRADKTLLLATAVLSAAFHVFIGAHKQWCVLRAMGVDFAYRDALRLRLGAGPLRVLVPLDAGELVNIVFFWRHKQMRFGRASGAMMFDRGLGLIGSSFWLMVGLVLLPDLAAPVQALLLLAVGVVYGLFFFLTPLHHVAVRIAGRIFPKLGGFVEGILAPFREFSVGRKLFFMAYGVFFQVRSLAVCFLLFLAYGVVISLKHAIAYTSIAVLAGHIPTAVGSGPREAAIVELFSKYGPDARLLSIGLLLTATVHVIPMLVGIPWVAWVLKRLLTRETAPPAAPKLGRNT